MGKAMAKVFGALLLAAIAAGLWFVWIGVDSGFHSSPVTMLHHGDYGVPAMVGCGLSLILVCILATLELPVGAVVPIMAIAFTLAWSWTASRSDETGLWSVGAMLVFVATALGGLLVSLLTRAIARRPTRW